MYDYKMMETLKNCPDDQIKTIREMMKHDMMMISTIDAALAARQIGNLKHSLDFSGFISEARIRELEHIFRGKTDLPFSIASYLNEYSTGYLANKICDAFQQHMLQHLLKNDSIEFLTCNIVRGSIMNYSVKINGILIERSFSLILPVVFQKIMSVTEVFDTIFNRIRDIIKKNKLDLCGIKTLIENMKSDYQGVKISLNNTELMLTLYYKDDMLICHSYKISQLVEIEKCYDIYFKEMVEPLFRKNINLPEWMISHFEQYPESKFIGTIRKQFIKYIKYDCSIFPETTMNIVSLNITKNIMSYKIDINGHLVNHEFNLFDVDPSKAKSVDEIANEVYNSVQLFINEHKLNLMNFSEHIFRNTKIVNFPGVKLRINDSLLDIEFVYKDEPVTVRSKTLSYIAEEPKKKPSTKAKAKKVVKKK